MSAVQYRLLADLLVAVHAAFVAFVVLGQLAILLGLWRGWRWVRGFWFRSCHLAAILLVVAESLLGLTCPLTLWEQRLRAAAGGAAYGGSFLGHWLHELLFFTAPAWVFTVCYTLFGGLVLITFLLAPPGSPRTSAHRHP